MGNQSEYHSQLPWVLDRPTALVIACSDGRWRPHIQDFVTNCLHLDPHFDVLQVPGGAEPLTLADRVPKDFNFFRRRLDMLMRIHRLRRIVMIAHENCAWYHELAIQHGKMDLRSRQIADLRYVRTQLRDFFGGVAIETYYARLDGNGSQVIFEAVT